MPPGRVYTIENTVTVGSRSLTWQSSLIYFNRTIAPTRLSRPFSPAGCWSTRPIGVRHSLEVIRAEYGVLEGLYGIGGFGEDASAEGDAGRYTLR